MIEINELVDWHQGLTLPLELGWVPGPRLPEFTQADNIGMVTPTEGPGEDLEGAGDFGAFQVKIVGREFNLAKLQSAAFAIDSALRSLAVPADIWGTRVVAVSRVGGQPSLSQEDDHDRISFICNYLVHEVI